MLNTRLNVRSRTVLALPLLFALVPGALAQGKADKPVDFLKDVVPIFKARCFECHGVKEQEGDVRLDLKAGLFVGDKDNWVVIPGDSKTSILYERITLPADDEDIMPNEGKPLTKAQIAVLKRWIDEGAKWPEGADAKIAAMVKSSQPKIEKLDLPVLTAVQKLAETKAIAAIEKAGGLAMRVAANSTGTEVNLSLLGDKATNAQVELTSDLAGSLVRLNLSRTKIDDAALETIGGLSQLRWLNLARTQVTDAGLRHLTGLAKLEYLNLYGTKITDAGLSSLHGLKNLQSLYLWQTKVSKKGAATLRKTLPNLRVDLGEYAEVLAKIKPPKPKKAKAKTAAPINEKCPLTGKPLAADKFSVFEGQVIGFCCGKCKAAFDKNPQKHLGKVKEFKKTTAKVAANKKCPVTGKKLAADAVTPFRGQLIGFCCNKCKAKFVKNPDKFLPKLAGLFPKK